MPLQNRVAPDGMLHARPARGLFTGNRGVIHDPDRKTLLGRRWTTPAWIVCTLDWQGRRREVWGRNRPGGRAGWTELFFLDEVTALAAGHRPCFYCRRAEASAFAEAFDRGNGLVGAGAPERDRLLHAQRWLSARMPAAAISRDDLAQMPEGSVVESQGGFFAIRGKHALRWDFGGYTERLALAELSDVRAVTPAATRKALAAGYQPRWHPSAG